MSQQIIGQYQIENPNDEIHLLTWRDNSHFTGLITNIKKHHYIDRQSIQKTMNNELFSKSYSINMLWSQIEAITEIEWNQVFLLSNEETSAIIPTLLNTKLISGCWLSDDRNINYSNLWARVINEIYPAAPHCFNKTELLSRQTGINVSQRSEPKRDAQFDQLSIESFNAIRKRIGNNKKIIGIDASIFSERNTNISSVMLAMQSDQFIPVLIYNKRDQHQVDLAKEINSVLHNKLISVCCEPSTSASVISQVDAFISGASYMRQLAQALNVACLEIHDYQDPHSNTGYSINNGDLLLRCEISQMNIVEIMSCLKIIAFSDTKSLNQITNDLYQVIPDYLGRALIQLKPIDENLYNISNLSIRYFLEYLCSGKIIEKSNLVSNLFNKIEISNYVKTEQNNISKILSELLMAIRFNLEFKETNNPKRLLVAIDKIFSIPDSILASNCLVLLFKSKLDNLACQEQDQAKAIDELLFEFKHQMQDLASFLHIFDQSSEYHPADHSKNRREQSL